MVKKQGVTKSIFQHAILRFLLFCWSAYQAGLHSGIMSDSHVQFISLPTCEIPRDERQFLTVLTTILKTFTQDCLVYRPHISFTVGTTIAFHI